LYASGAAVIFKIKNPYWIMSQEDEDREFLEIVEQYAKKHGGGYFSEEHKPSKMAGKYLR